MPIQLASWPLSRQPREPQERQPCSGPGCSGAVYARGLCVNHYKRWIKGTWVPPFEPVRVRQRRVRVGLLSGAKSLTNATDTTLAEVGEGDRIMARGTVDIENK